MPDEAYNLGCDAYNDGNGRDSNPYEVGTEDYNDWDEGWIEARDDAGVEGEEIEE